MDAYDQLQATASPTETNSTTDSKDNGNAPKLQTNIDQAAEKFETGIETAFQKLSTVVSSNPTTSAWGSKLGGFWSKVRETSETALKEVGKDFVAAKNELDDLLISATTSTDVATSQQQQQQEQQQREISKEDQTLASSTDTLRPESEGTTNNKKKVTDMLGLLTKKAQLYIDDLDRDLEVIENKAGSYLTKVGTDLKSYLKDAVNVERPGVSSTSGDAKENSEVLFNVPEDIRSQIYSTRLDAQLHALHTSKDPFLVKNEDPAWEPFLAKFDVDKKTDEIAADLEKYPELRKLMDEMVAEIGYKDFWTRYYFMREQIAVQEEKRKQLLKETVTGEDEEELGWDDDEEEDEEKVTSKKAEKAEPKTPVKQEVKVNAIVSEEKKKSLGIEDSRPSSEASYDLVSKNSSPTTKPKPEESDSDDDWE